MPTPETRHRQQTIRADEPGARVLILRAPGTNCEHETAHAWSLVGGRPRIVRLSELIHQPALLSAADILTIPGGFSYGDDLSAGTMLAFEMEHGLGPALRAFIQAGKLILGICNGFQALLRAGLLPGEPFGRDCVTLTHNITGRFEDRWVHISVERPLGGDFDRAGPLHLPIAHAEGRLVTRSADILTSLESNGRVFCRYVDSACRRGPFPINPNGSDGDIAGLIDGTGRVIGLMPHPERNASPTHNPFWTRNPSDRTPDGITMFRSLLQLVR